ncbi:hypothetical protein AB0C93_11530 [Streptomyces sp. NPDC048518]|uniref:hypothetical protein n=1 Tax=Streptomyces sp. NPDC048518 TaxID=3155029 RepID=UPI0033D1C839
MGKDPLDSAVAWDLYVALNLLAASHALEAVPGVPGAQDDLTHARAQVDVHRRALKGDAPELLARIDNVLNGWVERPTSRLLELLPLVDELSRKSGGALPDTLPPAP